MIKCEDDKCMDLDWRLCNMPIETGVVPEDWSAAIIIPLYMGK